MVPCFAVTTQLACVSGLMELYSNKGLDPFLRRRPNNPSTDLLKASSVYEIGTDAHSLGVFDNCMTLLLTYYQYRLNLIILIDPSYQNRLGATPSWEVSTDDGDRFVRRGRKNGLPPGE
jgi:hypothetical protein